MEIGTFIQHLIDAFEELTPENVNPESALRALPVWDSLAILIIITIAISEYQVPLTDKEIHTCVTVRDIFTIIKRKHSQPE